MENKQITKAQALAMATILAKGWNELVFEVPTEISDKIYGIAEIQPIELFDKLESMVQQQVKQDNAKRGKKGTSKVAKEKAENMNKVRAFFSEMTEQNALTLAEIGQAIGLDAATPQKLSAIMKPLVDNEEFEKTTKDKKVAYQVK